MRETGPIRKGLSGDTDAAATNIGPARVVLGQLKNQMVLGGLQQGTRTVNLADGTSIQVTSKFGQDTVRIDSPPPVVVLPEIVVHPEEGEEEEDHPKPTGAHLVVTGLRVLPPLSQDLPIRVNGVVKPDQRSSFQVVGDKHKTFLIETLPFPGQFFYQAYLADSTGAPLSRGQQVMKLTESSGLALLISYKDVRDLLGALSVLPDFVPGAYLIDMEQLLAPDTIADIPQIIKDSITGTSAGFTLRFAVSQARLSGVLTGTVATIPAPPAGSGASSWITIGGAPCRWSPDFNFTVTPVVDTSGTAFFNPDPSLTLSGPSAWTASGAELESFLDMSVTYPSVFIEVHAHFGAEQDFNVIPTDVDGDFETTAQALQDSIFALGLNIQWDDTTGMGIHRTFRGDYPSDATNFAVSAVGVHQTLDATTNWKGDFASSFVVTEIRTEPYRPL